MKVPLSIADFLSRAALVYPDRVGVVDEADPPGGSLGQLSYRDVLALAKAQAAWLDRLGVEPGERVAIVSKNSARLLISFFATSGYGRILVPINFRLGREEVAYIVEHSGASVMLIDPELDQTLAGISAPHRFVLDLAMDREMFQRGIEPAAWEGDEDATASINYTSGTTARPKGVELTHRNCWVNAMLQGLHLGVSDRDVYLHTVPMFHCNGWGILYVVTGLGGRHIVLRQVSGSEILRRVEQHGVTLMGGAPTVMGMILEAARTWDGTVPGAGRVRVVVAGAPPPTSIIQRVESELGWEFIQIYGLTETSPLLTVNRRRVEEDDLPTTERAQRLSRAGAPALGVQLQVSQEGEVLARGNVVLKAYWRDPEATAEAIRDGWFHTGDGGTLDDEHHISIIDRKKDVIISGGENVSSIEVENVLCSHPAVAEVAIIGVPHDKWGETVKALVVLVAGSQATEREMLEYCRARLAHYKCPTSVEFRDQLARTATGKLQKFKLRAPYWTGRTRQVN